MERKPSALEPSASMPLMPHTERIETLKMYGDAPVTVSVSTVTVALATLGVAGRLGRTNASEYVKRVSLRTAATFVEML